MLSIINTRMKGSKLASALFIFGAALIGAAAPVRAQQNATVPPASSVPVPGELELAKLIWTTMAAVDSANQAGNYTVLRDLAAPDFQINNDPARLTQIFANLRASGIDLSNTLLLAPTYAVAPTMPRPGIIRVQGYFGLRPTAISFDLYFQWVAGKWRLDGVSIAPATISNIQPAAPSPPPVKPKRSGE